MMIRWIARVLASVLVLSLGYGWLVRAADTGRLPSGSGSLQPVFSAEAVRAGYTLYESESRIGRAMMVRRRTGDEPIAWELYMPRPMTTEEFYAGRVRETLDDRLSDAIVRGVDTMSVELVGWPWAVWTREFRVDPQEIGPARMKGFVSFGRFGVMTRPSWPAFLLWVVALAMGMWAVEHGGRAAARRVSRMRTPYGHCVSCGYDLIGIEGAVCPECGKAFDQGRGA